MTNLLKHTLLSIVKMERALGNVLYVDRYNFQRNLKRYYVGYPIWTGKHTIYINE